MSNHTIIRAERELYLSLLQLAQYHASANDWLAQLPKWLADIKDKSRYAHAPAYQSAVARLPDIDHTAVDLHSDVVSIEVAMSQSQQRQITALLKQLMPWRKGPFFIGQNIEESTGQGIGQAGEQGTGQSTGQSTGQDSEQQTRQQVSQTSEAVQGVCQGGYQGVYIDTEWHSDYKWQRIAPHLSDLRNRRILDVGGGSGYHGWRMAGAGAKQVIVIDPSCLFYHQFMAMRHFIAAADDYRTHYIPVGLEALPEHSELFDTVFSMGVLYHRPSPFEHLQQLKGQLVKGGELVLETLVVEGDQRTVLVPHDRYAQMNNVYFLPSVAALTGWLVKVGFTEVRCVDVSQTRIDEQRATPWMTYQSLADFLDPKDQSLTIEGYPAPMRATLIAKK